MKREEPKTDQRVYRKRSTKEKTVTLMIGEIKREREMGSVEVLIEEIDQDPLTIKVAEIKTVEVI